MVRLVFAEPVVCVTKLQYAATMGIDVLAIRVGPNLAAADDLILSIDGQCQQRNKESENDLVHICLLGS